MYGLLVLVKFHRYRPISNVVSVEARMWNQVSPADTVSVIAQREWKLLRTENPWRVLASVHTVFVRERSKLFS